jgi:hypothetical protein
MPSKFIDSNLLKKYQHYADTFLISQVLDIKTNLLYCDLKAITKIETCRENSSILEYYLG